VNEHEREQLQAEALDAYLTDLQSGRPAARPDAVPADQAAFLHALIDLAEANFAETSFASRLGARLRVETGRRAAARRKAMARPTYPRPWDALWGRVAAITERMFNMNRRLLFSMASAIVLVLILFAALAFLDQNEPAVGPDQVAQQPTATWTLAPTTGPTPTSLPPAATPTAVVREISLPTATPTAIPKETALPTTAPMATPTVGLKEPIVLPSLAKWQGNGYGGSGIGDPLLSERTFALGTALPEGPAQMAVYTHREPEPLTATFATQMAERLGLNGQVYMSLRMAASPDPDNVPLKAYLAVQGAREMLFEHTGISHYTDRKRISFHEGCWNPPEGLPPLAQAVATAEAFLRAAGLLEGEYQVTATGDTILFYRLLEGGWLLVEPFARVHIWTDGQVGQVTYWHLDLDQLAEYPVISAQEAWEILSTGQPDERVWQNPYRSPEMPSWGAWSELVQKNTPTVWARPSQVGQQVHRFGSPRTWFPTEAGGTPFLAMGDLVLIGDVQSLAEYALEQYIREQWNYVHVWGEVGDRGEYQTLRVEGWEPAEETYWAGTVQRQDGQDLLLTDDGRTVQLPDLPADLPDGAKVYVSGGEWNHTLEWFVIQESLADEDVPPAEVRMTVEQVDLAYLALAPDVIPPERFSELGYRAVQPVWRFRGHSDQGTAFEAYVQAVSEAYLDNHPQ